MSIIHLLSEVSLKIIALSPSYEFVNIPNNLHQTPLHLAVATRQLLLARRLMVAGASLEAPDHCGNTPLHVACREGLADMVQFLLTPVQKQETHANSYTIPMQCVPQDLSIRNYDGRFHPSFL
jgi:ankyrin repeat protein